jgi:uncharacterized protein YpiB (UPF0302 family)
MSYKVSTEEKRLFMDWFLSSFELQKRECAWLITYLMSDQYLLERLHFVDSVQPEVQSRSIILSTKCTFDIPFCYKKGDFVTTDVERAFHDIRLHPKEAIYVKVSYRGWRRCPEFAMVREAWRNEQSDASNSILYRIVAEVMLDEAVYTFQRDYLYQQIDAALDRKDKAEFMKASKHYLKVCQWLDK